MKLFQIADPVVYDLDLLFYHRHAFGKAVMLPHFPRQLFHLRFHNGLSNLLVVLVFSGGNQTGYNYAN